MKKSDQPIAVSEFLWIDKFLLFLENIELISHKTSMDAYLQGYSRAAKDVEMLKRPKEKP